MEGNACYKFSTIKNYIAQTGTSPISVICDIGSNAGAISLMMREYFPEAEILAFEALSECYEESARRLAHDPNIKVFRLAVTSSHVFEDDLGRRERVVPRQLKILRGLPASGSGWYGGSIVVPLEHEDYDHRHYAALDERMRPVELRELVEAVLTLTCSDQIDLMKMDCEGCEAFAIGCAPVETLRRLRFIVGEYHDIERFYAVMVEKLYHTHYVNLIGGHNMGAFFAERKGEKRTILKADRTGMLQDRPWLASKPIDWHLFRSEFVLPEDRGWHAL